MLVYLLLVVVASAEVPNLNEPRDFQRGEVLQTWLAWDGASWRLSLQPPESCASPFVRWTNGPLQPPGPDEPRLRYAVIEVERKARWKPTQHRYGRPLVASLVGFRDTPWPGISPVEGTSENRSEVVRPLRVGQIYRSHLEWDEAQNDWKVEGADELGLVTGEPLLWTNGEALESLEHRRQPVLFEVVERGETRTIGRRCGASVSTIHTQPVFKATLLDLCGDVASAGVDPGC